MNKRIGIIGSGTAGLQLVFSLKNDFDVTLLHCEEPDEIRSGTNSFCRPMLKWMVLMEGAVFVSGI